MAGDDGSFGLALRFTVDVGNTSLGTWSKCEGIEMHFDVAKYQEGGAPGATWNYTHYATGRANYVPIKLTRAVTQQASSALLKWLSQQASSPQPQQVFRCWSVPGTATLPRIWPWPTLSATTPPGRAPRQPGMTHPGSPPWAAASLISRLREGGPVPIRCGTWASSARAPGTPPYLPGPVTRTA